VLGGDGAGDEVDPDAERPVLDPELLERYALPFAPSLTLQARPYQREAVRNWLRSDGRGVVVLPTGAGKTVVAFQALAEVPVRTLVIVPTIELLRQWRTGLIEKAGVPEDQVGVVGGGERSPNAITVMTYDSAAMPRRRLNEFGLLI
jgi:superfamily II DNA or RNA helicase